MGKGFAGRIAAERAPVALYRVDHSTVLNPILLQKGIKSLLGVPLIADGDVVGVMHVGTMSRRRFTKDEIELLQLVADRVALALHVRLSDRARVVIEAFQRTFLPEVLPFMPGLRVATRYLPATTAVGVGGDWFDTFLLPGGEIVLVIGDVAGHGLPAASLMGKMRNALRAHALMGGSALDIVQRVDEFHRYFGEGELVTLLVGVLARDVSGIRYVSAGHPPPLVVGQAGAAFAYDRRSEPAARPAAAAVVRRGGGGAAAGHVGPPLYGRSDRAAGRNRSMRDSSGSARRRSESWTGPGSTTRSRSCWNEWSTVSERRTTSRCWCCTVRRPPRSSSSSRSTPAPARSRRSVGR